MKSLILGITSLAIANIFAIPAYADLSVGTSFNSGNTRVIIQYGTPNQYGSYDRHLYHHSHPRNRQYQNVVPIYTQPNSSYQVPNPYNLPTSSNPYNLPTSSNPYNLPIITTPVSPFPGQVYIYNNNPYSYHRHYRYYSH
ncbi:hypothetical protein [Tumidithrix helvetica]|uniref:hypothetical protein n=1 Tax=Tumidithrix helvetica TaxID=3457545 RepID=UPI003CC64111